MKFHLLRLFCASFMLFTTSATATQTLFLAGDSTMAKKHPKDLPETGWGVPFADFFSNELSIQNHAVNGRSTRTFIDEGRWKAIKDGVQDGDYVFIQFGHNDEVPEKLDRYTTPEAFKNNLTSMLTQVKKGGGTPVLFTPVTRRYFDNSGNIKLTHPYSPYVREIAEEQSVLLIDLDTITRDYFSELGDGLSKLRFMHLEEGVHPNYPIGCNR